LAQIYTRMSRWSKNGVLDRIFNRLRQEQMIRINGEAVSLDSTVIKVHPDGTGALKKRASIGRQILRRLDSKTSSDCAASAECAVLFSLSPGQTGARRKAAGC
ncbi:hypothetical protein VU07_04890, partial [Desulfobulbus sp. F4]|nr:hypothetical protein [Desulfobulbus sp. F4]